MEKKTIHKIIDYLRIPLIVASCLLALYLVNLGLNQL